MELVDKHGRLQSLSAEGVAPWWGLGSSSDRTRGDRQPLWPADSSQHVAAAVPAGSLPSWAHILIETSYYNTGLWAAWGRPQTEQGARVQRGAPYHHSPNESLL